MENKVDKSPFRLRYDKKDIIKGALVYPVGDTIAMLISGNFSITRLLGVLLIGSTVYAFEIPNYFRWINLRFTQKKTASSSFKRAALAQLYFNPLWIARHLLFINLFSQKWDSVGLHLLPAALLSFICLFPISFSVNYLIQQKLKLRWRFLGSAIFSGLTAIYYALSEVIF